MAYTDAASLRSYLGITDVGDDALLTLLIARAQQHIDQYTGTTFEGSNANRTFDAARDVDGTVLKLDRDLASINTITNGDGTTVSSSDYVTEPRNDAPYYAIRIKASATIRWEPDTSGNTEDVITVNGVWAYSTTAPADVIHAALRLAAWFYRQRDNADMDRPVVAGNATILPSALPRDVLDVLKAYRQRI